MKLLNFCLFGITIGQQCGVNQYQMTPGLIEHAKGNYKSEWDMNQDPSLPAVPDYEEIMIWDKAPGRSNEDGMNPEDGAVGDFEHPDFFEKVDGGDFGGDRTSGISGDENTRPLARIVGGNVAQPFSHPWQVRVRACSGFACTRMCGGTLVSDTAIVTASHCIPPYANSGTITLGVHEYFNTRGVNITIASIHQHPGWDKQKRINDIAVIKLAEPVTFSSKIQPACLPNKDHCFEPGTACVASGWGYIKEGGPRSSLLREVAVRIMESDHCNKADYYNGRILDGMLCAGYNAGERDACTGDSGGPLVCPLPNGQWVLTGVTSWGVGCARHKRPGVYTDVRQFSDWVSSLIHEYPDVVGSCSTRGVSGFGTGGDYSFGAILPQRPPSWKLIDSTSMEAPKAPASGTKVKPDLDAVNNLWNSAVVPTTRPTTRRTTTTTRATTERAPSKEMTRPTMRPRPPVSQNRPSVHHQQSANTPAKGAGGHYKPCDGLAGRHLKKCRKALKKKSKKNKKVKKNKKKTYKALFDDMSKKEKKAYKADEAAAADRDAFVEVDTSMEQDDNVLFAGWDMN